MADSALNYFVARGTAAERAAFTPAPPTPASGPDPLHIFYETDTGDLYGWDGAAWDQLNTGGGGLVDGDYGDITVSGSGTVMNIDATAVGTAEIANDAVTFAKIQNTSAASKLIGRGSASGAGDVEEITVGTGLSISGTTLNVSGLVELDYYNFASGALSTREVDVTGYKEITIVGYGLVHAASVQRVIQVSVDGGSTWFTTSGDYETVADTGIGTAGTAFIVHNTATASARNIALKILNNSGRIPVVADNATRQTQQQFVASATAINRIRLGGMSGGVINAGNFTAGTLQVLGRI
jgi:hypothetical protein